MKCPLEDLINLAKTIAMIFDGPEWVSYAYWSVAIRGHHTRTIHYLCCKNVKHGKFLFNSTKYVVLLVIKYIYF